MFSVVLALCFLLRIVRRSRHFAPKFIESHFGTAARLTLKSLERVIIKLERRRADVEFLKLCQIYCLTPKFTRFKLHKPWLQSISQTRQLRKKLVAVEIQDHLKAIGRLERQAPHWTQQLASSIGQVSMLYAKCFLETRRKEEHAICNHRHNQKLLRLGLDITKMAPDNSTI